MATPKRLVKLAISPRGEEPFSLVGSQRKAMRDEIKMWEVSRGWWHP